MHPNPVKPGGNATKEGDRTAILLTLPPNDLAFLDQLVADAKAVRLDGGRGHAKKIGRGDVISGLLQYLRIAQADPDATNPEEARLMALGLLE
jgi:hypothetical protein